MAQENFPENTESFVATIARLFAAEGAAREVAILASSQARIEQTGYDNWNNGICEYSLYLQMPTQIYSQVYKDKDKIEQSLLEKARLLMLSYPSDSLENICLLPEIASSEGWREKALDWVLGKNVNNQGRVRSDNIASRSCDGLLFRSQPEINFYNALKPLGISFAPLPVFLRGGRSYKRIEPDFVVIKDGIVMVIEIDGDTVHLETPAEAHDRTTILLHEGVHFERFKASECETLESAQICAKKILEIISKYKESR